MTDVARASLMSLARDGHGSMDINRSGFRACFL
jgi:hypothetical protein